MEEIDYQKLDYQKFFVPEGEPGFSSEHNKWVIEHSIRKYEAKKRSQAKKYNEQLGERIDAAMTWLKSRMSTGTTPIEKYFGRRWLAYLRGQKIMEKIQGKRRILSSLD